MQSPARPSPPRAQAQKAYGNRWTLIASLLPGRCNNDIKNYYNLYLKAQVPAGQVMNK